MTDADAPMMQIGELADRAEMSLRTIRHYDEVGLLTPSGRSDGGFRLYTDADFSRLMVIRRMKPLGFSLDEMAELLRVVDALGAADADSAESGGGAVDDTRARLDAFIADAAERRARLERQLAMADEFLELLRSR
ncbi:MULTISPECIES: MerR family transcriptional regulator [unclassified Frigoribacterium]|uniref:MerR family transcriptional regulator n=1 Tax=unclassified Frigoribacterium TaxID=2627005 RepID=UPI000F46FC7B|nr:MULTISPECIES: MerR family transcriptional regulator [unclassified Frigoribacterium]ROP73384.1 DNA-binding transcriptional MerR regulator [Frigoribacterium sp. PhB107]TDT63224.1 DNA-binding transcriptional MerR regulator [Frigoribacterium sp. PhB116]